MSEPNANPGELAELLHLPLDQAYLCQDCNCVSNCSTRCPACASEALMGLAGVLDRETESAIREASFTANACA